MRKFSTKLLLICLFSFSMMATLSFLAAKNMPQTEAKITGFQAGNIMSDAVMSNYNSMTEAQIQAFLKSKNHCNDRRTYLAQQYPSYTYHIKDGHFVCMADELFGDGTVVGSGQTAAHIIWQAAQDYRINPQVLIVLLQKEQGLITDTWPNMNHQYRSATGYGCPDTAACNSQYYGFKNQVRKAAELFRYTLNGGLSYNNFPAYTSPYIQYNPNSACGGSKVYIQNRATSALYRYTPYQPNAGAIANHPGQAYCGAYGNRNFYSFFTDWFGSTQGANWLPMTNPRWMRVKISTKKTDLNNNSVVDSELLPGRQIKFIDKTNFNGQVYLRTEWDYQHGYTKGIALQALEEIPYEPIENARFLSLTCSSQKISPNSSKTSGQKFPRGLVANFTSKVNINGSWYLRTETDTAANKNLGFSIDCVNTAATTQTLSFDQPRDMYIPINTKLVNIKQPNQVTTTSGNLTTFFSRKFYFNGVWYFQSENDYQQNRLVGPTSTSVKEAVKFIPMDNPRKMTLKRTSQKTDPLTGNFSGNYIPKSTTRLFVDKIKLNGEWHLRTQSDANNNIQLVFPISSLY